jgi:hypothetical protein
MKEEIEHRIKQMLLERNAIEINHEALIEQNRKTNQEFQQKVVQNQTRFAQLTGGILELQKLVKPKGDNNDNRIPTLSSSNRLADVCAGEQPEGS